MAFPAHFQEHLNTMQVVVVVVQAQLVPTQVVLAARQWAVLDAIEALTGPPVGVYRLLVQVAEADLTLQDSKTVALEAKAL